MTLEVRVDGVEELSRRLENISVQTRGKAGRTALRKAAQVIQQQAQANAARIDDPATRQSIERNISIQYSSKRFRRTGDIMFRVGVRGGAKTKAENEGNPGGDTFYWRFVEFGTAHAPAQPFLRPSIRQAANQALSTFFREYNRSLDRFAKRGIS